ncbi:hypothetical protein [Mycobacterium sp.]|uniref:hypothetical protein n=1 Tax=Mycobacterium sp. TaxID=1785 RepID=UPI002CE1E6F6|nr:hypothetical protein [Mycobacterium sp.]HTY35422.1 hypothetical protein [Mycobacterium sp.]
MLQVCKACGCRGIAHDIEVCPHCGAPLAPAAPAVELVDAPKSGRVRRAAGGDD